MAARFNESGTHIYTSDMDSPVRNDMGMIHEPRIPPKTIEHRMKLYHEDAGEVDEEEAPDGNKVARNRRS